MMKPESACDRDGEPVSYDALDAGHGVRPSQAEGGMAALAELCRIYWYPSIRSPGDAAIHRMTRKT